MFLDATKIMHGHEIELSLDDGNNLYSPQKTRVNKVKPRFLIRKNSSHVFNVCSCLIGGEDQSQFLPTIQICTPLLCSQPQCSWSGCWCLAPPCSLPGPPWKVDFTVLGHSEEVQPVCLGKRPNGPRSASQV